MITDRSGVSPYRETWANLEPELESVAEEPAVENNHSEPPSRRELTPRPPALWKAVQPASVQELSPGEISRQLGVQRNTVRNYTRSVTQPTNRPINRGPSRSHQPTINRSG